MTPQYSQQSSQKYLQNPQLSQLPSNQFLPEIAPLQTPFNPNPLNMPFEQQYPQQQLIQQQQNNHQNPFKINAIPYNGGGIQSNPHIRVSRSLSPLIKKRQQSPQLTQNIQQNHPYYSQQITQTAQNNQFLYHNQSQLQQRPQQQTQQLQYSQQFNNNKPAKRNNSPLLNTKRHINQKKSPFQIQIRLDYIHPLPIEFKRYEIQYQVIQNDKSITSKKNLLREHGIYQKEKSILNLEENVKNFDINKHLYLIIKIQIKEYLKYQQEQLDFEKTFYTYHQFLFNENISDQDQQIQLIKLPLYFSEIKPSNKLNIYMNLCLKQISNELTLSQNSDKFQANYTDSSFIIPKNHLNINDIHPEQATIDKIFQIFQHSRPFNHFSANNSNQDLDNNSNPSLVKIIKTNLKKVDKNTTQKENRSLSPYSYSRKFQQKQLHKLTEFLKKQNKIVKKQQQDLLEQQQLLQSQNQSFLENQIHQFNHQQQQQQQQQNKFPIPQNIKEHLKLSNMVIKQKQKPEFSPNSDNSISTQNSVNNQNQQQNINNNINNNEKNNKIQPNFNSFNNNTTNNIASSFNNKSNKTSNLNESDQISQLQVYDSSNTDEEQQIEQEIDNIFNSNQKTNTQKPKEKKRGSPLLKKGSSDFSVCHEMAEEFEQTTNFQKVIYLQIQSVQQDLYDNISMNFGLYSDSEVIKDQKLLFFDGPDLDLKDQIKYIKKQSQILTKMDLQNFKQKNVYILLELKNEDGDGIGWFLHPLKKNQEFNFGTFTEFLYDGNGQSPPFDLKRVQKNPLIKIQFSVNEYQII